MTQSRNQATAQSPVHFSKMRLHQRAMQRRDYANLTYFSHLALEQSAPEGRTGLRTMPVAIFLDRQKEEVVLPMRAFKRLYRVAKADAKKEALRANVPGPASVFMELAKKPYERLSELTRQAHSWDLKSFRP